MRLTFKAGLLGLLILAVVPLLTALEDERHAVFTSTHFPEFVDENQSIRRQCPGLVPEFVDPTLTQACQCDAFNRCNRWLHWDGESGAQGFWEDENNWDWGVPPEAYNDVFLEKDQTSSTLGEDHRVSFTRAGNEHYLHIQSDTKLTIKPQEITCFSLNWCHGNGQCLGKRKCGPNESGKHCLDQTYFPDSAKPYFLPQQIEDIEYGYCECYEGWTGLSCLEPVCGANSTLDECGDCNGNGTACTCDDYLGEDSEYISWLLLKDTNERLIHDLQDTIELLKFLKTYSSWYDPNGLELEEDICVWIECLQLFSDDCVDEFSCLQNHFLDAVLNLDAPDPCWSHHNLLE